MSTTKLDVAQKNYGYHQSRYIAIEERLESRSRAGHLETALDDNHV